MASKRARQQSAPVGIADLPGELLVQCGGGIDLPDEDQDRACFMPRGKVGGKFDDAGSHRLLSSPLPLGRFHAVEGTPFPGLQATAETIVLQIVIRERRALTARRGRRHGQDLETRSPAVVLDRANGLEELHQRDGEMGLVQHHGRVVPKKPRVK